MKLTQSKVDKQRPKSKRYVVQDGNGLSLCVHPSGAKSFQLRYRHHGRQKTLSFGEVSLKDARALAAKARVAIYEGNDPQQLAVARKARELLFGEFVTQHYLPHLRAQGKNADEAIKMLNAQVPFLWHQPIGEISLVQLKSWQNRQASEKTVSTANRYTNQVKAVTRYAKQLRMVEADPLLDLHRISQADAIQDIRWLTTDEEQHLRDALSARDFARHGIHVTQSSVTRQGNVTNISARFNKSLEEVLDNRKTRWLKDHLTPAVLLMLECGLRRQEALRLRWTDIRPAQAEGEFQLFICPHSDKSRKGRYVPLLPETLAILLAWQEDQAMLGRESEFVFPHPSSGAALQSIDTSWENLIIEASKRCPTLEGLTVKDLRSTYGSKLVQNGQPIFVVSKLLGHSSVTVTEKHYAALSDEGKREAVNTLSQMPKAAKIRLLGRLSDYTDSN